MITKATQITSNLTVCEPACSGPADTLRDNGVAITSKRHPFDVITLLLRHVFGVGGGWGGGWVGYHQINIKAPHNWSCVTGGYLLQRVQILNI